MTPNPNAAEPNLSPVQPVTSFDPLILSVALLGWALDELLTHDLNVHRGSRHKVQAWQLIAGSAVHCLPFTGRFSKCMSQTFGMSLSDSALSQRRKKLGPEICKIVIKRARCARDAQRCSWTGAVGICLDYAQALWTVLGHAEGLMDAATQQELASQ